MDDDRDIEGFRPENPVQEKKCECWDNHKIADVTEDSCGCCMKGHVPAAPVGEEWEEVFDRKFKHVHHPMIQAENVIHDTKDIKSFIRNLLEAAEKRAWDEMSFGSPEWREFIKRVKEDGKADERSRLKKLIERMEKDPAKAFSAPGRDGDIALLEANAHNSALSSVLSALEGEE